jgi:hypothetical protein
VGVKAANDMDRRQVRGRTRYKDSKLVKEALLVRQRIWTVDDYQYFRFVTRSNADAHF